MSDETEQEPKTLELPPDVELFDLGNLVELVWREADGEEYVHRFDNPPALVGGEGVLLVVGEDIDVDDDEGIVG